jgi:2-desacetyl-2-hydroxyethyl bacteriochlorophyllide A dehydrogenase
MRAAVLEAPGRLVVSSLTDPEPEPDELLVHVAACGVCGTDRAIYCGEYVVRYPLIPGHELAGTVVRVGAETTGFRNGDRVTVDPNVVDYTCYYCRHGVDHLCSGLSPLGVVRSGGFAEFARVPSRYAYRLPDSLSLEVGSQIETIACCVHGIDQARITTGDLVAVLGSGPIGCLLIQLTRLQGAGRIVVSEPNPARRRLAELSGADVTCDPDDLKSTLHDLRSGVGPDVVIEASGNLSAAENAVELVRRGGTVLLFAVYPESARIEISPFRINEDELRIAGSLNNPHTHQRAIDLVASGRLDLSEIITDLIELDELERAMDVRNFPTAGKILVVPKA